MSWEEVVWWKSLIMLAFVVSLVGLIIITVISLALHPSADLGLRLFYEMLYYLIFAYSRDELLVKAGLKPPSQDED